MPRSRKVDPKQAVGAAMAAFWQHGYGDLGTRALEQETGITRFTLQTTYGGKMALFLTTLDTYLDDFEHSGLLALAGRDLEGIAAFFEMRADALVMQASSCHGCFLLNSTVEFGASEPAINQRADRHFAILRAEFQQGLNQSKDDGVLGPEFNIPTYCEVLLATALGLNVAIRAAADTDKGRDMAAAIAALVRSWA